MYYIKKYLQYKPFQTHNHLSEIIIGLGLSLDQFIEN